MSLKPHLYTWIKGCGLPQMLIRNLVQNTLFAITWPMVCSIFMCTTSVINVIMLCIDNDEGFIHGAPEFESSSYAYVTVVLKATCPALLPVMYSHAATTCLSCAV